MRSRRTSARHARRRSGFERFYRDVVAELTEERPLGFKEIVKRVKGGRQQTLRTWLTQIVAEGREVVHDPHLGYSLRTSTEAGYPRGEPRTPKGARPPRTPPTGNPMLNGAQS